MITRWASWWFKHRGWKFMGTLPKRKTKVVLVVGPHASVKDFILLVACNKLTHMQFEFILDKSDFTWFTFPFLSALCAKKLQNTTLQQCLNQMGEKEFVCKGFMTNTLAQKQFDDHSMFYDLAFESKSAVVLIGIDHRRKMVKFHNPFLVSGNKARDLQYISGFFENYFSYERQGNSLER